MNVPLYYNWRHLVSRRLSTGLTLLVLAVMIFVLSLLLSFAEGIQASLVATGRPDNIIVLKPGATAESTSLIVTEEAARLAQTPGIARDPAGNLLSSAELCTQTPLPRLGDNSMANVAVRGVDDVAFAVHSEVRIIEGRRFNQGATEVIVGAAAKTRYAGLEIGDEISIGRKNDRRYTVVGVFDTGGGAMDSEIWGPRSMLMDSYQQRFISSIYQRLADQASAPKAIEYIRGPTVQLDGRLETQYYADLATKTRDIVVLTSVLVGIMAAGAIFAVANTMYSAVDGRRREIAMLRAIGFAKPAIILAFVTEAMLLSLLACGSGLAMSWLMSGTRQDFLSDVTWTVLVYDLRLTPRIVLGSVILALLVGTCGTLAPAIRASRINVLEALRKA